MTGAYGNSLGVQDRADVVRVQPVDRERQDRCLVGCSSLDIRAWNLTQLSGGVLQQCSFVDADRVDSHTGQVPDSLAQTHGTDDVGRASLEALGNLRKSRPLEGHRADHLAPELVGSQTIEPVHLPVQGADAGRTVHLVAREDVEVAVEVHDVYTQVGHSLGTIDQHPGAHVARHADDLLDRVDRAEGVGHVHDGHQARSLSEGPAEALDVQLPFVDVKPTLVDASGAAMQASTLSIGVYDIGPALSVHEMHDMTTVASWGTVEPYMEGPCATTGCLSVRGWCGSYAGIAGQLRTEGATEAVLSMRVEIFDNFLNSPALSVVEVVAEDGTRLTPTSGGDWDAEKAEQVWVYDVTGHKVVGFSMEASSYCHGWGGPLIVDAVYTQ